MQNFKIKELMISIQPGKNVNAGNAVSPGDIIAGDCAMPSHPDCAMPSHPDPCAMPSHPDPCAMPSHPDPCAMPSHPDPCKMPSHPDDYLKVQNETRPSLLQDIKEILAKMNQN